MGYLKQAGNIPCETKCIAIDRDLAFVHVRYLMDVLQSIPIPKRFVLSSDLFNN